MLINFITFQIRQCAIKSERDNSVKMFSWSLDSFKQTRCRRQHRLKVFSQKLVKTHSIPFETLAKCWSKRFDRIRQHPNPADCDWSFSDANGVERNARNVVLPARVRMRSWAVDERQRILVRHDIPRCDSVELLLGLSRWHARTKVCDFECFGAFVGVCCAFSVHEAFRAFCFVSFYGWSLVSYNCDRYDQKIILRNFLMRRQWGARIRVCIGNILAKNLVKALSRFLRFVIVTFRRYERLFAEPWNDFDIVRSWWYRCHSVSGYSTTMYAYIGEFNTDKNRSAIISWISVSIGFANIFIPSKIFLSKFLSISISNFSVRHVDPLIRLVIRALQRISLPTLATSDVSVHVAGNHRSPVAVEIQGKSAISSNEKSNW